MPETLTLLTHSRNDRLPPPFVIKLENRYKKIELILQVRKIKPWRIDQVEEQP